MFLGAASMIGTTGAGSKSTIPHEFDVLTYSDKDLNEGLNRFSKAIKEIK